MVTSCPAACTLKKRSLAILGRMAAIMKPSVPTAKVPTASQYSDAKRNFGAASLPQVTAIGPAAGVVAQFVVFIGSLGLAGQFAAIDSDGRTRDEGGLVGSDKHNGLGKLFGLTHQFNRNSRNKCRPRL